MIQATPYIFKDHYPVLTPRMMSFIVMNATGNVTVNVSSIPSWVDGTLLINAYDGQSGTVSNGTVTFNSGANGVILIENPNPVILPTITATPENNSMMRQVLEVCLSGFSIDCSAVTVYYTFDLNAPENDFSSWTTYNGCFSISESTMLKAVAVNNSNNLHSEVLTLNYFTELPDMHIYYKIPTGIQMYIFTIGIHFLLRLKILLPHGPENRCNSFVIIILLT